MRIALIQQHATPDRPDNLTRGLAALEAAAAGGTRLACNAARGYYVPRDTGAPVYRTALGRIGVAICSDRLCPEYMRALAVAAAEIVVAPQAGAVGEWPAGLYEAETRVAALQNGYATALCNRVGEEPCLTFGGESFVCAPDGRVVARSGWPTEGAPGGPAPTCARAPRSSGR